MLAIPEGFARTLAQGRTATVQLLLDGADANTATTVLGYATALAADANLRRYTERTGIEVVPWATNRASSTTPNYEPPSSWFQG